MANDLRTCLKCGWVHFGVTRQHAEDEVSRFNTYFDTLDQDGKDSFGNKKSSIRHYERCFFCSGPWTNFRPYLEGDCPEGVTIQPIIVEQENGEGKVLD